MTESNTIVKRRSCPPGESILSFADVSPFEFYERMRAIGSPVWDEQANAWLLLDFDQCADAERNETRFANAYVNADPIVRQIKGGGANLTLSSGKEHRLLRRLHLKLLSPARVERYRQTHIRPIIDFALDRLEGRDRAELSGDFAAQIPPRVICSLLGMPYEDGDMMARILQLNEQIVNFIASGYSDLALRDHAIAASAELNEMLLPYVRARRETPADDFISRVWAEAPDAGFDLDEEQALGLCRELYFAGSDTTVHGITNLLYLLLTDSDAMARVRSGNDRTFTMAIEELLRLYNVVQFRHRFCVADCMVGDVQVRKGEMVILAHAAANRDPAKYGCPAHADFGRSAPTDHLAFAQGSRSCVGAQLARQEMRDAVTALLARYPDLELDNAATPPRFKSLYIRSMAPLEVLLH